MDQELFLRYMSGPKDGELLVVGKAPASQDITFGRQASSTVSLPEDPEISRTHAKMYRKGNEWWLEDLGSSNGSFVGEFSRSRKIAEGTELKPGTIFRVGRTRFMIEQPVKNQVLDVEPAMATL